MLALQGTLPLISRRVSFEQRGGLAQIGDCGEIGGGGEQRPRHQRRMRLLLPDPGARRQRFVHAPDARERRGGAEQGLVGELAPGVLPHECEQRVRLLRVRRHRVGKRVRALLLDALQVLHERPVGGELVIPEEAERPAVHAHPVPAQVLDVEDEVRGVFGELVFRMGQRDPGEVAARGIVIGGEVLEAPCLERHLDRVRSVGERLQIETAGSLQLLLVGGERPLRATLSDVLLLYAAVEQRLVPGEDGAPGRLLQPAAGLARRQILAHHGFILVGRFRPRSAGVQQLSVEEPQVVRVGRLRKQDEVFGVESARRRPGLLQVRLARLVVDLHRQIAQRLFAEPVRFLVALVFLHRCPVAGGADPLDDLDELLRFGKEIAPLAAPLRENQQARLIQRCGGRVGVQGEQLAMDEL